MDNLTPKTVTASLEPDTFTVLGIASVETKGGGVLLQPDSNQPMRQAVGIQQD